MIQSRNSCGAGSFSSSMLAHLFASDGNEVKGGRVACPKTWGGKTPSRPMDMAHREQLPDDGGQHAAHSEVRHNEQVWKHGGVPGMLVLTFMLHRGQTLSSAEDRRRSGAPIPPTPLAPCTPLPSPGGREKLLICHSSVRPISPANDSLRCSMLNLASENPPRWGTPGIRVDGPPRDCPSDYGRRHCPWWHWPGSSGMGTETRVPLVRFRTPM